MSDDYQHDYEAFDVHVLAAPWMVAEMRRRAEKVKERAEATAPVGGEDDPHRGLYKASFEVDSGVRNEPTRRAFGRVTNTAPYAIDVEYGSKHNRRYRTLGRALDAAGD